MLKELNKTYPLLYLFSFSLPLCYLGASVWRRDFSFSSYSPKALEPHVKKELSHSVMSNSLQTPQTLPHQASLSMGFSRQEYWSGLPCPPLGDLPDLGIELRSPMLRADSLPSELPGKPQYTLTYLQSHLLFNSTLSMIHRGSAAYFPI